MNTGASARRAHLIGLGLDHQDGHIRITRGENFAVLLGSEETHARLSATCLKLNEQLARRGKQLADLSRDEFIEMVSELD